MLDLFEPDSESGCVEVAVLCFYWGKCKHVERGFGVQAVHDAMESHYAERHAGDIEESLALIGRGRRSPASGSAPK